MQSKGKSLKVFNSLLIPIFTNCSVSNMPNSRAMLSVFCRKMLLYFFELLLLFKAQLLLAACQQQKLSHPFILMQFYCIFVQLKK